MPSHPHGAPLEADHLIDTPRQLPRLPSGISGTEARLALEFLQNLKVRILGVENREAVRTDDGQRMLEPRTLSAAPQPGQFRPLTFEPSIRELEEAGVISSPRIRADS